jgi:Kef-type K+ transport system membrane component KefB
MTLIIVGALLLIGLVADLVGRRTFLPRVTLLLLSGLAIGASGLELIPSKFVDQWFPPLTQFALAMVGFLLGQQMTVKELRAQGMQVLLLATGKALGAALAVALILMLFGTSTPLALILAGIATATAPAATYDVVEELGTKTPFARLLLKIVAFDDAIGLIIFVFFLAAASTLNGADVDTLPEAFIELGSSIALGFAIGIPMTYLTGRVSEGTPTQAEAFGFVLLCAGLADWLQVSPILSAMVAGAVVGSLAKHHTRPFHAIESIEWPFLILFFILAGASVRFSAEASVGTLLVLYIIARAIGTCGGVYATGAVCGMDRRLGAWLGPALMPQAGVALGMALLAAQQFPEFEDTILATVLMSTVILEVVSPVLTRAVLERTTELAVDSKNRSDADD